MNASSIIVGEDVKSVLYLRATDNKQPGKPEIHSQLFLLLSLGATIFMSFSYLFVFRTEAKVTADAH